MRRPAGATRAPPWRPGGRPLRRASMKASRGSRVVESSGRKAAPAFSDRGAAPRRARASARARSPTTRSGPAPSATRRCARRFARVLSPRRSAGVLAQATATTRAWPARAAEHRWETWPPPVSWPRAVLKSVEELPPLLGREDVDRVDGRAGSASIACEDVAGWPAACGHGRRLEHVRVVVELERNGSPAYDHEKVVVRLLDAPTDSTAIASGPVGAAASGNSRTRAGDRAGPPAAGSAPGCR